VVHDGGLLLMLATILRKHRAWRQTALRVFIVCQQGDDPAELKQVITTFLYNMRIAAALHVVQIDAPLSGILPTRGAEWTSRDGSLVPRVNKAMVATPLGGNLALAETTSYRDVGSEPSLHANTFFKDQGSQGGTPPGRGTSPTSARGASGSKFDLIPPVQLPASVRDHAPAATGPTDEELNERRQATRGLNTLLVENSAESALVMTNLPLPKEEGTAQAYMEHLELLMAGIPRALLVAGQRDAEVITMYS